MPKFQRTDICSMIPDVDHFLSGLMTGRFGTVGASWRVLVLHLS